MVKQNLPYHVRHAIRVRHINRRKEKLMFICGSHMERSVARE